MAWTQADVDALKRAIAKGVMTVRHGETSHTYRSLREMKETLRMMEAELAALGGVARTRQIRFKTASGL